MLNLHSTNKPPDFAALHPGYETHRDYPVPPKNFLILFLAALRDKKL
jgi:hypothetical protein